MSDQTRDRVLYPILLDLAEADIKWSIAFSVKSVETIQAILNKQYWAPLGRRQSDDPSWLRLSHVRLDTRIVISSLMCLLGRTNCQRNGHS